MVERDELLPIYLEPGSAEEVFALRELPLLYQFEEPGKKKFILVEDHRAFHDMWDKVKKGGGLVKSLNPLGPDYDDMKRLAEQYGKEIDLKEIMKGKVALSLFVDQGDKRYIEYRFKGHVPDNLR